MKFSEKLRHAIVKVNIPLAMFCLFSTRLVITGASLGDAFALISLAGLSGLSYYLNKKKDTRFEEITNDIQNIKDAVQHIKTSQLVRRSDATQEKGRFF